MMELQEKVYHNNEFDININQYLSYAQIQNIINTTLKLDSWAERQTNIDMLILAYATDMGVETIQETGHELLLKSGLIDTVMKSVLNVEQVYNGIKSTESVARGLSYIVKELPKYKKQIDKALKNVDRINK